MKKDILYLASQSESRQKLLHDAEIEYKLLQHKSDESISNLNGNFESYVLDIAKETEKEARKEFSIWYGHAPYFRKKVIAMDRSFDNYIIKSTKDKISE